MAQSRAQFHAGASGPLLSARKHDARCHRFTILIEPDLDHFELTDNLLGGAPAIEASARATKAFQRARGVPGAVVLLRLVLAYCLRQGGLRSTAAWARAIGGGRIKVEFAPVCGQVRGGGGVGLFLSSFCWKKGGGNPGGGGAAGGF